MDVSTLTQNIVTAEQEAAPVAEAIATSFGGTSVASGIQIGDALLPTLASLFLNIANLFHHAATKAPAPARAAAAPAPAPAAVPSVSGTPQLVNAAPAVVAPAPVAATVATVQAKTVGGYKYGVPSNS